jgi:hypothetical protein
MKIKYQKVITVFGKTFASKEAFALWLDTAPKEEVLPLLYQARRNAFIGGDDKAYDKIDSLIGKIEKE